MLTYVKHMPQRPHTVEGIKFPLESGCAPPSGSLGYTMVNAEFITTNPMIETDAANTVEMAPPV